MICSGQKQVKKLVINAFILSASQKTGVAEISNPKKL